MRLKALIITIVFSMFFLVSTANVDAQVCTCNPLGQVATQQCGTGAASDCAVGTKRVCTCGGGTGGGCTPTPEGWNWVWSCQCLADNGCTSGSGNPTNPGCTPVAPTAPTSIYTSNPQTTSATSPGRVVKSNVLRAGWSGGGYGDGCPTVQGNDLQIRPDDLSLPFSSYGNVTRTDKLEWNTIYRWRVRRSNGNTAVNSALSYFTTGRPPSITNFTIGSQNTCSATVGYVGTSANEANNPLVIQFDVFDTDNDFGNGVNILRNARIGITPNIQQYRRFDQLEPNLYQPVTKNAAGFRVVLSDFLTTSTRRFASTDYADGSSGAYSTSGSLANATSNATLLGLNGVDAYSSSVTQIDNQTLRVKLVVRLENNFTNGQFNVFATVVSRKDDYASNELINVTPNPSPADTGGDGNLRYTNYTFGSPTTYQVDLTAPTAAVSNPTVTGANSFNLNWSASDNISLAQLYSYCYLNSAPTTTIRDVGLATNIGVGATQLNYPSVDNCLVNSVGRLGTRSYTDLSGGLTPGMNFRLHVRDNACNSATATSTLNASNPWLMTGNGNASANGGYTNFNINDTTNTFGNIAGPPFLSTYLALSGNNSIVTNKPSSKSLIATNYLDKKISPPVNLGTTNWTDAVKNIISKLPGYVADNTVVRTLATGNLSSTFGVAANTYTYRYFSGNLVIPDGVVCNIKAVIVVELNTSVSPNFVNSGANNGCVVVSKGRIQIEYGPHSSVGGSQQYDTLNGLFITDSIFYDLPDYVINGYDKPSASLPADGLYIRGGVIARQVSFRRDLQPASNVLFPANIIEYDPTYLINFGSILSNRKFSLRQE